MDPFRACRRGSPPNRFGPASNRWDCLSSCCHWHFPHQEVSTGWHASQILTDRHNAKIEVATYSYRAGDFSHQAGAGFRMKNAKLEIKMCVMQISMTFDDLLSDEGHVILRGAPVPFFVTGRTGRAMSAVTKVWFRAGRCLGVLPQEFCTPQVCFEVGSLRCPA